MSIRALFWNVENFKGNEERATKVVDHVRSFDPDVIGFCEIKDKAALRSILQDKLYDYDFGITDGAQGIELLAGWKRGVFDQALYTQRREFKAGNESLRPGSLLSLKQGDEYVNFLFLHTDSGRTDRDYSNRQDMFEKIWSLRDRIDELESDHPTRLVVMMDANTMGKKRRAGAPEITGPDEISALADDALHAGMSLLTKSRDKTWARVDEHGSITLASDLDHVIISDTLRAENNQAVVRGWVDETDDAGRYEFVENISDHCSIECVLSFAN